MFRFPIFNPFRVPRSLSRSTQITPYGRPGAQGDLNSQPHQFWQNPLHRSHRQVPSTPQRLHVPSALTNFKPKMLRGFEPLAALEGKSFDSGVVNSTVDDAYNNYLTTLDLGSNCFSEIPLYQPTTDNRNWYLQYDHDNQVINPLFTDATSSISSSSHSLSSYIWTSSEQSDEVLNTGENSSTDTEDRITASIHNGPTSQLRTLGPNIAESVPRTISINSHVFANIEPLLPPAILPPYDAHAYPEEPPPTYEEATLETHGGAGRYFLYEDESEALRELDSIINDYIDTIESPTYANFSPVTSFRDTLIDDNREITTARPQHSPARNAGIRQTFQHWTSICFPVMLNSEDLQTTSNFSRNNESADFAMY